MRVRRWEPAELELTGTAAVAVQFVHDRVRAVAEPFRSGDRLLARFAPGVVGRWTYTIMDSAGPPIGEGTLDCEPEPAGDHGPVGVLGTRFAHADGTPHLPLPTNLLDWHRRPDAGHTLGLLRESPITAVRLSVLDPERVDWPDDAELDRVEWAVTALAEIGRRAELVLFGDGRALNRDGWREHLRRVVSRFAGFRTVAWCLAVDADRAGVEPALWREALDLLAEHDHGHRPCTVHAGLGFDFGDPRISYASVRTDHARSSSTLTDDFAKPAVLDGLVEGDAPDLDGSRTAEAVVLYAWETAVRGGFPTHAERWVDGGGPRGEALPRLSFLHEILAALPGSASYLRLRPDASTLGVPDEVYLQYLGAHRFRSRSFDLPDGPYRVEVIDTWSMTVEEVLRTDSGSFTVQLEPRLYYAIRATRC
ncbi:DUF5605 domain-containing protein [Microlunatus parietis]|uniref:DUF5605 domain-containing protein n=1 Tax=Microlunatus parietis TaxID=682979 RepID=A0A7Y9I5I7_9ACTN|nr:DUF5605 domain-containing protein [Microlunatus parietis]NYE70683.1 hypothetical protein [Microlunatus parietis]